MILSQLDEQETTPVHSDHVYSNILGDMKYLRRFISEIVLHDQTTVQVKPDGRITIIPRPRRQLPNEILSLIINELSEERQTLYQCTLVTKQFNSIATALLWQDLEFFNNDIKKRFVAHVSSASDQDLSVIEQHTRKLDLDHPHWKDTRLERLLPYLSQLEHLNVSRNTFITGKSFQHVPFHCRQLTSLRLDRAELTLDTFSAIGQYCHQLEEFSWTVYSDASPSWLQYVLPCPLKYLNLSCYSSPLTETTVATIRKFDRLIILKVNSMDVDSIQQLLLPTTTKTIPLWPQLTSLHLNYCTLIEDDLLIDFMKTHPQLEELFLYCAINLTNRSLHAMVTLLPKLTSLDLFENRNVTADDIRQLVCGCLHLERLVIFACQHISTLDFHNVSLDTNDSDRTIVIDQRGIEKIRHSMA